MSRLVILGSGTAGTIVANKLRHRLDRSAWDITVVDRDDEHHYQPGYLFIPFGEYSHEQVVRSRHAFLAQGVAPLDAASVGVLARGLAGDAAARRWGRLGLIASDLTAALGEVWTAWGR